MNTHYTTDRSTQMVLSVLKAYGIKKIVVSPGTTNMAFVASAQSDPCFEMYSSVDERSAAYIACGLSQESGEAVVISCTGATASRDYMPGLTEAYYRKLPVLAITGSHGEYLIGHLHPQVIDRSVTPNDIVRTVPISKKQNVRMMNGTTMWKLTKPFQNFSGMVADQSI